MSELAGPLKPLAIFLESAQPKAGPTLSHIPPVKEISDTHRWVVSSLASGFKPKEVAKMFGIAHEYVLQINNWDHPELDRVRQEARDRASASIADLGQRFQFHAEEALGRTVQIMRGPDIANARLAAKDIMDRAGYAPVKKVAQINTQVPSAEFIDAIGRAKEAFQVEARRDEWAWKVPDENEPKEIKSDSGRQVSI